MVEMYWEGKESNGREERKIEGNGRLRGRGERKIEGNGRLRGRGERKRDGNSRLRGRGERKKKREQWWNTKRKIED
jgi:hypothetical protein